MRFNPKANLDSEQAIDERPHLVRSSKQKKLPKGYGEVPQIDLRRRVGEAKNPKEMRTSAAKRKLQKFKNQEQDV